MNQNYKELHYSVGVATISVSVNIPDMPYKPSYYPNKIYKL